MKFLETYSNDVLGPIQKDEAILLYGLTLSLRPRHVLEFGSYFGHSTRCFLEGGATKVTAVDCRVTNELRELRDLFPSQLDILEMNQSDFCAKEFVESYRGSEVDLVFFDASHVLDINQNTWRKIYTLLAQTAHVLVHDTGLWAWSHMKPEHFNFPGEWKDIDAFAHQPGEIAFAEWLEQQWGLRRIDVHSQNTLRHGLSIFQL